MSDKARILFVDDEEAIRSLILTVLEGDGHEAVGAGSAAEAEKAFDTAASDLPVIDMFRVGAEVIVLPVQFGLYLNFGQFVDFLVGFTTFDLAHDDGVCKCEVVEWRRDIAEREEAEAAVDGE